MFAPELDWTPQKFDSSARRRGLLMPRKGGVENREVVARLFAPGSLSDWRGYHFLCSSGSDNVQKGSRLYATCFVENGPSMLGTETLCEIE